MTFDKYEKHGAYHYEMMNDPFYRCKIDRALSYVMDGKMLDIGCGDGVLIHEMGKAGMDVHGIDSSAEGIRLAKMFTCCTDLRVGRAEDLPWASGTFDLCIMLDVVNYLDDVKQAISEAARVLVKGGKLVIMSPVESDDEQQQQLCSCYEIFNMVDKYLSWKGNSFISRSDYKRCWLRDKVLEFVVVGVK